MLKIALVVLTILMFLCIFISDWSFDIIDDVAELADENGVTLDELRSHLKTLGVNNMPVEED